MFIRQYGAFFSSTFPWLFVCIICWWLDRLFMELGHRRSETTFCYHNNLQYVNIHCMVTILAVCCQSAHSIWRRNKNFKREAVLLGVTTPCTYHLYILQSAICCAWAVIFACIIDVSPWLCFQSIVQKRASIAAIAMAMLCALLYMEQLLYNRTLQLQVDNMEI